MFIATPKLYIAHLAKNLAHLAVRFYREGRKGIAKCAMWGLGLIHGKTFVLKQEMPNSSF